MSRLDEIMDCVDHAIRAEVREEMHIYRDATRNGIEQLANDLDIATRERDQQKTELAMLRGATAKWRDFAQKLTGVDAQDHGWLRAELDSQWQRRSEYAGLTRDLLREVFTRFAPKETVSGGLCGWCSTYKMQHLDGCIVPRIDAALAASPKDQGGAVSDGHSDNAADSLRKREGGRNDIGPTINGRSEEPLGNQHVGGDAPYPAGSPVTASVSLGASEPSTPTIPEGYALVPKEPTHEMCLALALMRDAEPSGPRFTNAEAWKAMLAAAPAAPVSVSGDLSGYEQQDAARYRFLARHLAQHEWKTDGLTELIYRFATPKPLPPVGTVDDGIDRAIRYESGVLSEEKK